MQSFVCVWFFVWLGVCIKVAVSYLCGRVHIHSCLLIKNHLSMFAKCLWGILSAILLSDTHVFSNRLTFLSLCELKRSAKWGITNSLSCLLCVCVRGQKTIVESVWDHICSALLLVIPVCVCVYVCVTFGTVKMYPKVVFIFSSVFRHFYFQLVSLVCITNQHVPVLCVCVCRCL